MCIRDSLLPSVDSSCLVLAQQHIQDGNAQTRCGCTTSYGRAELSEITEGHDRSSRRSTPIHGSESRFTEEHIHEARHADVLISIVDIGITRIPMRVLVSDCQAMTVVNSHRQRRLTTHDILPSRLVGGQHVADIEFARCEVDHRPVAEYESK